MNRRPWPIVLLAFFHLLAPIVNIALNAMYSHKSVLSHFAIALSWPYLVTNWGTILIPVLCAWAIYSCKRWSFYLYFALLGVLFYLNYQGYMSKSDSFSLVPLFIVYTINLLVVTYFLVPAVRNIYFNPRLRWWEQNSRYSSNFSCTFEINGKKYPGHISNLSLGGLFIKTDDYPADYAYLLTTFEEDNNTYSFRGRAILHYHQEKVGFGVEFIHTPQSFVQAKKICSHLETQGNLIERDSKNQEDSLWGWAKKAFTSGKGFFPEV